MYLLLAATVAVCAVVIYATISTSDRERIDQVSRENCRDIEALKLVVRPDPYNAMQAMSLLRDIGIDPDSQVGKRLLEQAKINTARERRELAPSEC